MINKEARLKASYRIGLGVGAQDARHGIESVGATERYNQLVRDGMEYNSERRAEFCRGYDEGVEFEKYKP